MANHYAVVKALVPKLSSKEKRELLLLLKTGDQARYNITRQETEPELYHLMCLALKKLQGKKIIPYHVLKTNSSRQAARVVALQNDLENYFREITKDKADRITRAHLLRFLALYCELTAQAIIKTPDVPLALTTLIKWGDRFPGILDKAFPGYVASGMLHIALTKTNEVIRKKPRTRARLRAK